MNRITLQRRTGTALFLLAPLLAGCIPVFYAYPTAAFVPAVPVEAPPAEVRAFRLDATDENNCIDFPEHHRCVLTPVSLTGAGSVPPQMLVALDYGWVWNCIALVYDGRTHHTVLVRLYRPGFRTVEIKAEEKAGQVAWEKAVEPETQEMAVDDLLSTWETDGQGRLWAGVRDRDMPPSNDPLAPLMDKKVFASLAAGSASSGHQRTLLFAASEYERLEGALSGDDPGEQARLADKANWLRELAAK